MEGIRGRRSYDSEFKRDAVKLVIEGKKILGIHFLGRVD